LVAGSQVLESTLNRSEPSTVNITAVFDLDGTVADTAADLIEAANAALATEGLGPASAGAIKKGVGYGAKAMLQSAIISLGRKTDTEQLSRLSARLVTHYEENIAAKTRLFPGFNEAAADLREAGIKLALCTNKRERLTLRLLSELGIGSLFDAMACGDTFPFHKPDPRHITELVRIAGGELSAAIMVGDSEADIAAARGAGIPVIATAFGYAAVPAGELGADAVMQHYAELTDLIRVLLPRPRLQ
jgi:phosphoglycolate phosphatase